MDEISNDEGEDVAAELKSGNNPMSPCDAKAIKVIDDSARRIGGYATIWGELDCDKDRMTQKAILPYLGKGAPYMFWLHGLDTRFGANTVGVWDTQSFNVDGIGLYVEGNVSRDVHGDTAWQNIKAAGSFGLSVGSIWYLVKKEPNADGTKNITDWPLLDISLMEGGKQCVPSARQNLKADVEIALRNAALKMGIEAGHTSDGGPVQEFIQPNKEVKKMTEQTEAAVDVSAMVADQVAKALKAQRDEEERQKAEQARFDAAVAEATKAAIDQTTEALSGEFEAKLEAAKAKKAQPQAPVVGADGEGEGKKSQQLISVLSPYDRLSTMDLCQRYEVMRSYGKTPSNRFYKALANRVEQLGRTEDTLYIKNGEPVKAPAIDIDALAPRNLDLAELDGEIMGIKGGNRSYELDSGSDSVTKRGVAQFLKMAGGAIKADELDYSTQASFGDEWVPTLMTAELWRTIRLEASVLNLFDQFDMPSQPYDWPTESTDPTFYLVGESTDESQLVLTGGPFTDSKVGTAKVTFTAGKMGAITYWSEEMEEDAIIAFEPQVRDQYGQKVAHTIDEVLLSGDQSTGTENISFSGATIATASRFLTLDGLRHQPLITTTTDSFDAGTLAFADFINARSKMGTAGVFGVDPSQLAHIMDAATYYKALQLTEVVTLDVFGSRATVLSGQLGNIGGIPIIVSEDYALTDSTGFIDGATAANNTLGSFLTVNRRGIKVGWRRRPRIRVVGLPGAESRYIVASARLDIGFKEAGMVALGYNVTVT